MIDHNMLDVEHVALETYRMSARIVQALSNNKWTVDPERKDLVATASVMAQWALLDRADASQAERLLALHVTTDEMVSKLNKTSTKGGSDPLVQTCRQMLTSPKIIQRAEAELTRIVAHRAMCMEHAPVALQAAPARARPTP